ncbi:MAG TPA: hypothetical protein VME46_17665 [Acidimicrobiales bacterium]|nr:hypothetical protein [Acidimicrobiales bacterium]
MKLDRHTVRLGCIALAICPVAALTGLGATPPAVAAAHATTSPAESVGHLFPSRATIPGGAAEGGVVSALSCANSHFCVAAASYEVFGGPDSGTHDTYWTFDGKRWSPPTNVKDGVVGSVSCPTTGFCVGVGALGQGAPGEAQVLEGGHWSAATVLSPDYATDVSCSSRHFCIALLQPGSSAHDVNEKEVVTYNGDHWSKPSVIYRGDQLALEGISCASSTLCVAVASGETTSETDVLGYHGAAWSAPRRISAGAYPFVSCASTHFCMVVSSGTGELAQTFNGATWSAPASLGYVSTATSLSCAKGGPCVLTGNDNSSYEQTWVYRDGRWSGPIVMYSTSDASDVKNTYVSCPTASFCMVVDAAGRSWWT